MKPELENLKKYTNKASLTSGEKLAMFENIRAYTNTHPVQSKYGVFFKYSLAYASMFALLIGTSATSIAAEGALPGDLLYPVKINVNETVVKSLTFSKTQKAKVAVNLMDKRMEELEKMIVTKVDSPEKIDLIVAKLEKHKEDFQTFTNQVEQNDPEEVEEAGEIYVALESVIETHIDILEDIAEDEKVQVALSDITDNIIAATTSDTPTDSLPQEVVVTITTSATNTQETSINTMVLSATNTVPEEFSTSTPTTEDTGEEDAIKEITNFSHKINPLIIEVRSRNLKKDEATSTQIRKDVRKRIIENAEKRLRIDIEESSEDK
jgi:hypothetical protein